MAQKGVLKIFRESLFGSFRLQKTVSPMVFQPTVLHVGESIFIDSKSSGRMMTGTWTEDRPIRPPTTPYPPRIPFVDLNSENQKSPRLFGWFHLGTCLSDRAGSTKNRKAVIISKTSRMLFPRKSLVFELQVPVDFYSEMHIFWTDGMGYPREGNTHQRQQLKLFRHATISTLNDKNGPNPVGDPIGL